MGKKYLDTKQNTLEAAVMKVWQVAEEMDPVNPKAAPKSSKTARTKTLTTMVMSDEYLLMSIFISAVKQSVKR